jgi:hypothetical protein
VLIAKHFAQDLDGPQLHLLRFLVPVLQLVEHRQRVEAPRYVRVVRSLERFFLNEKFVTFSSKEG